MAEVGDEFILKHLKKMPRSYWVLIVVCVLFYAVFFPFIGFGTYATNQCEKQNHSSNPPSAKQRILQVQVPTFVARCAHQHAVHDISRVCAGVWPHHRQAKVPCCVGLRRSSDLELGIRHDVCYPSQPVYSNDNARIRLLDRRLHTLANGRNAHPCPPAGHSLRLSPGFAKCLPHPPATGLRLSV